MANNVGKFVEVLTKQIVMAANEGKQVLYVRESSDCYGTDFGVLLERAINNTSSVEVQVQFVAFKIEGDEEGRVKTNQSKMVPTAAWLTIRKNK